MVNIFNPNTGKSVEIMQLPYNVRQNGGNHYIVLSDTIPASPYIPATYFFPAIPATPLLPAIPAYFRIPAKPAVAAITTSYAIPLYVVSNYEIPMNAVVINYESATGDGGLTIMNGRTIIEFSIDGTILGDTKDDVNNYKELLRRVVSDKRVIEFLCPYPSILISNKYTIEDIKFNVIEGYDNSLPFTIKLKEYRIANVKTTATNQVSFQPAVAMEALYKLRYVAPV